MNKEKKEKIAIREAPKEDWFLQILVNIVNKSQLKFGITLNVGGFLISGELISGKDYFEKFGSEFASPFQGKVTKSAKEKIKKMITDYGGIYDKKQKEIDFPAYIHLKDAKFFSTTGKPIPYNQTVLWRSRIAEIQGFILGSLREE